MDEPALPRPARGAALIDIGREDLDLYAVEELQARIAALEVEVARTRQAMLLLQGARPVTLRPAQGLHGAQDGPRDRTRTGGWDE